MIGSAGKRDKRITIQHDTGQSLTDGGEHVPQWVTYANRWASIEDVSGLETFQGRQIRNGVTHLVTIPRDSVTQLIDPDMRISYSGRIFGIVFVDNRDDRQSEMQIQAMEEI